MKWPRYRPASRRLNRCRATAKPSRSNPARNGSLMTNNYDRHIRGATGPIRTKGPAFSAHGGMASAGDQVTHAPECPSHCVTIAGCGHRARTADLLGYCAFGRGQPKRAERDVMRTPWLGSCSWQLAQARTLRPWDKAVAPPRSRCPACGARLPSLVHLARTCTPSGRRLPQVSRKHTIVRRCPDMPGSAARSVPVASGYDGGGSRQPKRVAPSSAGVPG